MTFILGHLERVNIEKKEKVFACGWCRLPTSTTRSSAAPIKILPGALTWSRFSYIYVQKVSISYRFDAAGVWLNDPSLSIQQQIELLAHFIRLFYMKYENAFSLLLSLYTTPKVVDILCKSWRISSWDSCVLCTYHQDCSCRKMIQSNLNIIIIM